MLKEAQIAFQQGKFAHAHELASRIPAADRQYPNARFLSALAISRVESHENAIQEAKRLVADFPNMAQAQNLLGRLYVECDQYAEAEIAFQAAVEYAPADMEARQNWAIVQDFNGYQFESYQTLLPIIQNNAPLRLDAAKVLVRNALLIRNVELARNVMSYLEDTHQGDVDVALLSARVRFASGDVEIARQKLDEIIESDSGNIDAAVDLAFMEVTAGNETVAINRLREVLKIDPSCPMANFLYAHVKGSETDDMQSIETRISHIKSGLELSHVPVLKKAELRFAAGKTYDSIGRYDDAMKMYRTANETVWERLSKTVDEFQEQFERVKNVFTPALVARLVEEDKDRGSHLIFIVGMPRSGTTLLEQVISRLAGVEAGGETGVLEKIKHLSVNQKTGGIQYPESLEALSQEHTQKIYNIALERFAPLAADTRHRTMKDMQLFFHIGYIRILFPGAKIIHCRRNPVDTCLSAYFQFFRMYQQQFTYDLKVLGRYYASYREIMKFWDKLFPGKIMAVDYESFVGDLETESKKISEFCKLQWDKACLDFQHSGSIVRTASASQVRQGVYTTSRGRWRNYEPFIGDLLNELGEYV